MGRDACSKHRKISAIRGGAAQLYSNRRQARISARPGIKKNPAINPRPPDHNHLSTRPASLHPPTARSRARQWHWQQSHLSLGQGGSAKTLEGGFPLCSRCGPLKRRARGRGRTAPRRTGDSPSTALSSSPSRSSRRSRTRSRR